MVVGRTNRVTYGGGQGNILSLLKYKGKIHEEKEIEILGEIELIQKQDSLEAEIQKDYFLQRVYGKRDRYK